MAKKTNRAVIYAIIAVVVIIVGSAVLVYRNQTSNRSNTQSTINTSNWKTYTDSIYHFSFNHPIDMDFTVNTNLSSPALYVIRQQVQYYSGPSGGLSGYLISFDTWDNPQKLDLEDWIAYEKQINLWIGPAKLDTSTNAMVGGEKALRFWGNQSSDDTGMAPGKCEQSCPALDVYFVRKDKVYRAELTFIGEVADNIQTLSVFDQILSTFTFIN